MNIHNDFENGIICTDKATTTAALIEFTPHKTFNGVALKHLVTGDKTNYALSCHLVRIDPLCALKLHTHPQNLEVHEVIAGGGKCVIGDVETKYRPGIIGVIPQNVLHEVVAGPNGLYILATFSPALL